MIFAFFGFLMSVSKLPSSSRDWSLELRTQWNAVVWSFLFCVALAVAWCKTQLARVLSKEPRSKEFSLYTQTFIGQHRHLLDAWDTVSIDHIVMHPFFSLYAVLTSEEKMRLMETANQTDVEALLVDVANRYNTELELVLHSSFDLQKDAESAILKNRTWYTWLLELVQEYETFKTLTTTPLFVLPGLESSQHAASDSNPDENTTEQQNVQLLAHLLEITCWAKPFLWTESVYSDKWRVSYKDVDAIQSATDRQDTVAISWWLSSQCIPMMTAWLMWDISASWGNVRGSSPVFSLTDGASLSSRDVRKYLVGKYSFREEYPTATTKRNDGSLVAASFSSYTDLLASIASERAHLWKANYDAYRRTLKNPDFQNLQHWAYKKAPSRRHVVRP